MTQEAGRCDGVDHPVTTGGNDAVNGSMLLVVGIPSGVAESVGPCEPSRFGTDCAMPSESTTAAVRASTGATAPLCRTGAFPATETGGCASAQSLSSWSLYPPWDWAPGSSPTTVWLSFGEQAVAIGEIQVRHCNQRHEAPSIMGDSFGTQCNSAPPLRTWCVLATEPGIAAVLAPVVKQ
jgi:hypothetical protein